MKPVLFSVGILLVVCCATPTFALGPPTDFARNVVPFLKTHCVSCHGHDGAEGGIVLEKYQDSANVQQDYDLWEKILRLVNAHQMPPADETQPTAQEIQAVSAAIETELTGFDCSAHKHPGAVTIRRLNKAEYNNTIRDLVGLDLKLADEFPSDDVGNGFDNIGDVLTLPPILLEKYLDAAMTIADRTFEDPAAVKRIFPHPLDTEVIEEKIENARLNVESFAAKAFRRPVTEDEKERLFDVMKFAYSRNADDVEIMKTVVVAILSNPHFIFRVEKNTAADSDGIRALNGYELASRLSYFLWSSMPDQKLLDLAASGELQNPATLQAEAKRMLQDPRSIALVENFAGQWLQLRDITRLTPDPELFPNVDVKLQMAMRQETELFFESVIQDDRNVLEFLNADFTYVNERLAQHYGMTDVKGDEFQKVSLTTGRRGILTHAGILMLTSNPTRTSPVKRGKWILENILAEPPPPPPADVPELEEGNETLGSLREQMEQHRSNEACAVCHRTMDALGFGLENFDAVGAWRSKDGKFTIDASGTLPGGRKFDGAADLMKILVEEKNEEFCRCLAAKLLTYSLGRGLSSYDRCTVKDCVQSMKSNDNRFSSLVASIVVSDPFRLREVAKSP